MYCAKCRAKIDKGDEVCKSCGASLVLPKPGTAEKIPVIIKETAAAPAQVFNIESIIGKTLSIFADNAFLFIVLGVCAGAGDLLKLAIPETALPVFKLAGNLISIVCSLVFYIAIMLVAYKKYDDRTARLGDISGRTMDLLPVLTLIAIIYYLLVFLGLVLLIVPGIYALTVFSIADAVYLAEKKQVQDCFKESRRLIKGHFFDVFTAAFIFVFLLPFLTEIGKAIYEARTGNKVGNNADEIIGFFIGIFAAPLGSISTIVIYMQAKRVAGEQV